MNNDERADYIKSIAPIRSTIYTLTQGTGVRLFVVHCGTLYELTPSVAALLGRKVSRNGIRIPGHNFSRSFELVSTLSVKLHNDTYGYKREEI